ncbi:hypothetical protein CASFOL_007565 [Castilleja foliolosa]|uniref:rRNA N-glycosylase n=1 Tax=Castilleja foliolosa TaxID=1961234 RepID=A0ABD3EDQ9_9LAMI
MPRKSRSVNEKGESSTNTHTRKPTKIIEVDVNEDFEVFIKDFRERLGELGGRIKYGEKYLMPAAPSDLEQSRFLHLKLGVKDGSIHTTQTTIQMRLHDIYVGGFANKVNKWFHLKDHIPTIPNADTLSFSDDYGSLLGKADWRNLMNLLVQDRDTMIKKAMETLAITTEENKANTKYIARSLLTIVVYFCECTRFNSILLFPTMVVQDSEDGESAQAAFMSKRPTWADHEVKNWGNLSNLVKAKDDKDQDVDILNRAMVGYNIIVPRLKDTNAEELVGTVEDINIEDMNLEDTDLNVEDRWKAREQALLKEIVQYQLTTVHDAEQEIGIINQGKAKTNEDARGKKKK